MLLALAVALGLAVAAAGCATTGTRDARTRPGEAGRRRRHEARRGEGRPRRASAAAKVTLCKSSSYAEVKALLGEPYRDGFAHGLHVASWKLSPPQRTAEPAVIAFKGDVAVDMCFDLPGLASCDLADRCAR